MSSDNRSSASYAYYSFPPTPNRNSPPGSAASNESVRTAKTSKSTRSMAPAPAAGAKSPTPKTPTKAGKSPASSVTSKLDQGSNVGDQASGAAKSATGTPATGKKQAPKLGPSKGNTSTPKLPPRPKPDETASQAKETTSSYTPESAEDIKAKIEGAGGDAKGKAEETTEDAPSTIGMKDNEGDEEDTPQGKISQAGNETGGEDDSVTTSNLEEAAPEPVDDGEDTAEETTESAQDTAQETTEGATESAEGAAEDAQEKTGDAVEGAKGLAGGVADKATKAKDTIGDAAGKTTEGDVEGAAGGAAEGAQETAEETAEDAQETAEDAADGVKDTAEDTADGVKDTAESAAEGAEDAVPDEAGDAVNGVKDTAEDAAEGVEGAAEDAAEGAEGAAEDVMENIPIDLSILKGLKVGEGGAIMGPDGEQFGQLEEGDPEDLIGQEIGDDGEILDEDGDVIGRVTVTPEKAKAMAEEAEQKAQKEADDAAEEAGQALPDIKVLKGLQVGEGGEIMGEDGKPLGKIVEGDPEQLIGETVNEQGEILDQDGDIIGRAEVVPGEAAEELADAKEGAEEGVNGVAEPAQGGIPDELVEKLEEAQEALKPTLSIFEGKKINKKGKILDEEGEVIGQLTEDSDLKQCVGKVPNEKGEILDKDGKVVGKVEIVEGEAANEVMKAMHPELVEAAEKAQEEAEAAKEEAADAKDEAVDAKDEIPEISVLEGYKVNKKGEVLNEDGEPIAKLAEGELKDVAGKKVNAQGEILDKDGNVIGRVEMIPQQVEEAAEGAEEAVEETAEETGPQLPPLSILDGMKCNKNGYIVDSTGKPIGKLVEGDAKKLAKAGIECDENGQFHDKKGKVIGRAETIPQEDEDEEGAFAGLDGLVVVEGGFVEDENGNKVGKLVEGDEKKLVGRAVDEDGDVIDKRGNVVGHAERYEAPEAEPEPEPEVADLSILKGLTVNKQGNVIGSDGVPIARLVEGNLKEIAGKKCDENGQIWNDSGKVIGRCELIPEEQREQKAEGPFAGLEGLVVVKGGWVHDEEGNVVGQVVEGDPKKLIGRAVDEDGDIIDKYGNVKGHAEPYEEAEPEPEPEVDLSRLEGKVVNKAGNVVDEHGTVFGRIVSGDSKALAGRKVDGKGQIWSDDGKVIGQAELIPGGEQTRGEGPFSGFESVTVGKDGICSDSAGQIVGRLIEGDPKKLLGRRVDDDGDVLDKAGNPIGKAERWEPEEKKREINPMSGRKVNKDGEVRDADGNLIGKLTSGNLATLVGKEIDDNGYVVDNDGNKIGECTLLENIQEEEPEPEPEPEPEMSEEERAKLQKQQEDAELAKKMTAILSQTLDRIDPILKQITEVKFLTILWKEKKKHPS